MKRINVVGMLCIFPNTNGVAINQTWSNNGHNCGLVNKFIWIFFSDFTLAMVDVDR